MRNSDLTSQNTFFQGILSQIISFLVNWQKPILEIFSPSCHFSAPLFPPSLPPSVPVFAPSRLWGLSGQRRLTLTCPPLHTAGPSGEGPRLRAAGQEAPALPSSLQTLQAGRLQKRPLPSQLAWLKLPTICAWALWGTTRLKTGDIINISTYQHYQYQYVCLSPSVVYMVRVWFLILKYWNISSFLYLTVKTVANFSLYSLTSISLPFCEDF